MPLVVCPTCDEDENLDGHDVDGTIEITCGSCGTVWARDTIPLRERSMLTIALLAATGNFAEIPMHIRATANTGASKDDVMEALLHVAVYAGVPKANHAFKLAKDTYKEMEEDNG